MVSTKNNLIIVLLAAVLLLANGVVASSTSFCPDCPAFGATSTCVRAERYFTNSRAGTFSCQLCANSTNPEKLASCKKTYGTTMDSTCTSLLTDTQNCGACGNKCPQNSACVNGVCECSGLSCYFQGRGKTFCDASKSCAACPVGVGACSFPNLGTTADCTTDLLNNTANCGACGVFCSDNSDTCTTGTCTCGTKPKCSGLTPHCVDGECVACLSSSECASSGAGNLANPAQYCDVASHTCTTCPAGKGSCSSFGDAGVEADCETDLLQTGKVANCGACAANLVGTHDAITCCSGVSKCGLFANSSAPTAGECAAASACGESHYCDAVSKSCLPLVSMRNNEVNCARNAANDNDMYQTSSNDLCGSCSFNASRANLVEIVSNLTGSPLTTTVCLQYSETNCGKVGNVCPVGQRCVLGECVCATGLGDWLSYNAFDEIDPEKEDETLKNAALPSCGGSSETLVQYSRFDQRASQYLASFIDCAAAASKPNLTVTDFADATARNSICTGALNQCNSTYCSNLYSKLMQLNDNGLCDSLSAAGQLVANCATKYKGIYDAKTKKYSADATCREQAFAYIAGESPNIYDYALLFGCDAAKKIPGQSTYTIPVTPAPANAPLKQLHYELNRYLMGDASALTASVAAAATVVAAALFVM